MNLKKNCIAGREEEKVLNRSITAQIKRLSELSAVLDSSPDLSQEELEQLLLQTPGINVLGKSRYKNDEKKL